MERLFRVGLVGAGMIAEASHLPAVLASPMVTLAAIVDPIVDRAAALAAAYGLAVRVAPRVDDVMGDIDGAIIAAPNDAHCPVAVACLRSGVPVLIEKPLASTYAEGEAIVRAAAESGRVVAVGYSTRFRSEVSLLKTLLDEGCFGEARSFVHQFGTPGGWAPRSAYNLDRRSAGGGVLVVTGTHFLDRMLYFWGYPDRVALEDDALGGPEANCVARFEYTGRRSLEGSARYSKTVSLPSGLVIETERGYVVLADREDADIVFRPHAKPGLEEIVRRRRRRLPTVDERSVYQRQLEDFVTACREGGQPLVDARQGLASLRLLEQLYASRTSVSIDWYAGARARLAA